MEFTRKPLLEPEIILTILMLNFLSTFLHSLFHVSTSTSIEPLTGSARPRPTKLAFHIEKFDQKKALDSNPDLNHLSGSKFISFKSTLIPKK